MHFATDHQTGLQDLQDQHDEKRLTLIGSRQSEPPLGLVRKRTQLRCRKLQKAFMKLCVVSASSAPLRFTCSLTAETQRAQRLRREFLDFLLLSRSLKVGGAPENVLIFTSLCRPGSNR